MLWNVLTQAVLWILATLGLALTLGALLDAWLCPTSVTVAVTVKTKQDADDLDVLLSEASRHVRRRSPIAVLISSRLMQGEIGCGTELYAVYQTVVAAYHTQIYVISDTETEPKQPPSA